jgi:hypothetical protein
MPIYINLTKFKCIKWSIFEKLFLPDFLEFTLVFYIFFSRCFFKFLKISNLKLKITDF